MKGERIGAPEGEASPEDVEAKLAETTPELLTHIRLLPKQLWVRHFRALQKIAGEGEGWGEQHTTVKQLDYLLGVLQAREKAVTEFGTFDPAFKEIASSQEKKNALGNSLRELLLREGNVLGSGQTARVKSFECEGSKDPIAVKYLLKPTVKTLSASGEHDMLREVETMTKINETANRFGVPGEYIRVPHPFFHYKRGPLQCYGMTQINGETLGDMTRADNSFNPKRDAVLRALKERFASDEGIEALRKEVATFMSAVHEVCLHGDIRLGNVMVDDHGTLYLIDFGQSVSVNSMSEETREQFDNLKELERGQMSECINQLRHIARAT